MANKLKVEKVKKIKTVPTEMITDEMRAAGVDESVELVSREELVEKMGEEAVAKGEAGASKFKCDNCEDPGMVCYKCNHCDNCEDSGMVCYKCNHK